MAGHILLISCLLAICLPIIFVQLPRFATVKETHAETEAETRSPLLRRLLSPSRACEVLRRFARSCSEANVYLTGAGSEQEQSSVEEAANIPSEQRWDTGTSRPIFQGDACADGEYSSKDQDGLRNSRASKKPCDSSFRRQLSETGLIKRSAGGRSAVPDGSPPRKTGRDLEARGLAMRLFPPDPVSEIDDENEYERCSVRSSGNGVQTPQEPFHRRPPPKNQQQSGKDKAQTVRGQTSNRPPHPGHPESSPSPVDGPPLPSTAYLPRSAPRDESTESTRCHCRHCRHICSESSVPSSPSVASTTSKEPSSFAKSPLCLMYPHACHCHVPKSIKHLKGRTCVPCAHLSTAPTGSQPKTDLPECRQDDTKAGSQKQSTVADYDSLKDAAKEDPENIGNNRTKDIAKGAHIETSKLPGEDCKTSMPVWQVLLVTMGLVIFVIVFAILVAHCLAFFLVYKTEARLGEVRAGLLRGGEMKLCLCGRG